MLAIQKLCLLCFVVTSAAADPHDAQVGEVITVGGDSNRNPMAKVVELLQVLAQEIREESREEERDFNERTDLYKKDSKHSREVIKKHKRKIAELEAELIQAEAFREGKQKDLENLLNNIAQNEASLNKGKAHRKEVLEEFQTNEKTFIEALDQLERAIEVTKKQKPDDAAAAASASAASAASFISVADNLKHVLSRNPDFSLTASQKETLNSFVRAAYTASDSSKDAAGEIQAVPSFLQRRSGKVAGPYANMETHVQSVTAILEDLRKKVIGELDETRKVEADNGKTFKEWETGETSWLSDAKKTVGETKMAISQSQQQSSQNQNSLMESKEIFKQETKHLDELVATYRQLTADYKIRLANRMDESIAVDEARRILTSHIAQEYLKKQSIGIVQPGDGATSLLQVMLDKTSMWRNTPMFKKSSALSLLELKATMHSKTRASAEPFRKVKGLIRDLLHRLQEEQNAETAHAAWCNTEMGKTAKDMEKKVNDVQKTKDRLVALQADLDETKSDLEDVTGDLAAVRSSLADATALREKEHKLAVEAIQQYSNAAKLVKRSIVVLRNYYERQYKREQEAGGSQGRGAKQRQGLGTGVIGILEVAADDFDKLHAETVQAEELAAAEFKKFESEAKVRIAVFEKDVEYKTRKRVKLEYDISQMTSDLKSYEKQLDSINAYMDKLKATCTVKGVTYEERKAKREEELASLREALGHLKSAYRP